MSNLRNEIGNPSAGEKFELLDTLWESLEADELAVTDGQHDELDYRIGLYGYTPHRPLVDNGIRRRREALYSCSLYLPMYKLEGTLHDRLYGRDSKPQANVRVNAFVRRERFLQVGIRFGYPDDRQRHCLNRSSLTCSHGGFHPGCARLWARE